MSAVDTFNSAVIVRDLIDKIGEWKPRYNARWMAILCATGKDYTERQTLHTLLRYELDEDRANNLMLALERIQTLTFKEAPTVESRNIVRMIITSIIAKRETDNANTLNALEELFGFETRTYQD